jgi:hypothetical protein
MTMFHVSMVVDVSDPDVEADDIETELRQLSDANEWTVTTLAVVPSD